MMSKFTKVAVLTAYDAEGNVLLVGSNHPIVNTETGELYQKNLCDIIGQVNCYNFSDKIADIKIEHKDLEGDYMVSCPADHMTDLGLCYALAACFNWTCPITDKPIIYSDGDLYVKGDVDILNLDKSFTRFDPWERKELVWEIITGFSVDLQYDQAGNAVFRTPSGLKYYTNHPDEILRRICISAVVNARGHFGTRTTDWAGQVPLSMVKKVPEEVKMTGADFDKVAFKGASVVDAAPDSGLAP